MFLPNVISVEVNMGRRVSGSSRRIAIAAFSLALCLSGEILNAAIQSSIPSYRIDLGDAREQERQLREAVKQPKSDPVALHQLGTLLYRKGRDTEARKLWDLAASREPELAVADVEIVFEQIESRTLDAARATLASVRAKRPTDPHVYLAAGQLAVAEGNQRAAHEAYEKAWSLAPKLGVVNVARGRFLQLQGDYNAARRDFKSATDVAPNQPAGWLMLALDDFRNDHIQESLENLRRAESSRSGQPLAEARLAELYLQISDIPSAYRWYKQALVRDPHDKLIKCRVGQMLNVLKRPDEAREVFRSLNDHEEFVPALIAQSQLEEAEGQWEQAAQLLERVLKLDENNLIANNNLAMLLVQLGRTPERALDLIERARDFEPSRPEIQSTYGCVLVHVGRHAEAVEVLRESVRTQPNESWLRYSYGVALAETGKSDEAREQMNACLLLAPDFPRKVELVARKQAD